MKKVETKKAVIYCRVSSKEQVEGTSLGSQEKACVAYAERNKIKVVKIFIEKGESAKTAERTEFQKAIKLCGDKKNGIDSFIVYKLDRFTRSQEDHAILKGLFKKIDVKLLSVTENFDETPMGKAMEGIAAIFAQLDNDMRSERCTKGMLERVQQGTWMWAPPLGYFKPYRGANISPDPGVSPLIRLGFEEYSKGTYTYRTIATFLSERGLKTKAGKSPSPQLMEKILKNPIYYGCIRVWGEHKGAFEPVVSKSLFEKCQPDFIQSSQVAPRSTSNPLFPLRRFVICNHCKVPLTGSSSTGRHGDKYPYYHHHDKKQVVQVQNLFLRKTLKRSSLSFLKT